MSQDETPEAEPESEGLEPSTRVEVAKTSKPEVKPEPEAKKEPEVGYVSLRKFAKTFDISKGTAIRWIKQGKIKGFRTYTGQWRIPKTEIAKVVDEFRIQPTPERPPHLKPKREKREKREEPHEREKGESDDFI